MSFTIELGYAERNPVDKGLKREYGQYAMARGRTGLAAGEAVLGLVIERPDSGFGLEHRLEERFGAARFAYSTAYNALYRMEREGLVRVVHAGGSDGDEGEARYEATERGIEHFRRWLRTSSALPVLRDELQAKVALSAPRELPRLIEMVRNEELACARELDRIRATVVEQQRSGAGRPVAQREWSALMALGVAHGEAAHWGGRIQQLAQLRSYLCELQEEATRRIVAEDRRRHAQRRQRQGIAERPRPEQPQREAAPQRRRAV